jgi:hypothetical protein
MTKLIRKPKKVVANSVTCPACGRIHVTHAEFGPFCSAWCLQQAVRALGMVTRLKL